MKQKSRPVFEALESRRLLAAALFAAPTGHAKHLAHLTHVAHVAHVKHIEHLNHIAQVRHVEHVAHLEHLVHLKHVQHVEHVRQLQMAAIAVEDQRAEVASFLSGLNNDPGAEATNLAPAAGDLLNGSNMPGSSNFTGPLGSSSVSMTAGPGAVTTDFGTNGANPFAFGTDAIFE